MVIPLALPPGEGDHHFLRLLADPAERGAFVKDFGFVKG